MQRLVFKFLFFSTFLFTPTTSFGKESPNAIKMADSLFLARQFTQSLDLYQQTFASGLYTPAMLLKMAYIEEGLSHKAKALYYLTLYHRVTHDEDALLKMEELAEKFKLSGYQTSDQSRLLGWYQQLNLPISLTLTTLSFLFFSLFLVTRRNKSTNAYGWFALIVTCLLALGIHQYASTQFQYAILTAPQTYVMTGPSAGASVKAISDEGHKVRVRGKKDVWYRVEWGGEDAYIKNTSLQLLNL